MASGSPTTKGLGSPSAKALGSPTSRDDREVSEMLLSVSSWCMCSVGMIVFNKLAVVHFPAVCVLVALQMGYCCLVLLCFAWKWIHFGSINDVLRWSMVTPFFSGVLLTSMLSLKHASMSLLVVLRCLSPIASLVVESIYPHPIQVNAAMLVSIFMMLVGATLYVSTMPQEHFVGLGWALINTFLAVGDRLLQRLMLAKDQHPVDISKAGVTLLNNFFGLVTVLFCAHITHEWETLPQLSNLQGLSVIWIFASCIVGVGISFTGIWCQSLISATSFLVLINVNKFLIIGIEAIFMSLNVVQVMGALVAILGGVTYGKAQEALSERDPREAAQLAPKSGSP